MNRENYVYFGEGTANGVGTAAMYPVSHFIGMESASATTAKLYFKPLVNLTDQAADGDNNEEVLITFPNTGTAGNLNFQQICEIIAGAMGGSPSGAMTVIADELNGNFIAPLTAVVDIAPGA
tara:strand:+ start:319 stop:684 length:366 start_codon:yes stop_codon:yes gene_type:complete